MNISPGVQHSVQHCTLSLYLSNVNIETHLLCVASDVFIGLLTRGTCTGNVPYESTFA
jgi:hypothetical protein